MIYLCIMRTSEDTSGYAVNTCFQPARRSINGRPPQSPVMAFANSRGNQSNSKQHGQRVKFTITECCTTSKVEGDHKVSLFSINCAQGLSHVLEGRNDFQFTREASVRKPHISPGRLRT